MRPYKIIHSKRRTIQISVSNENEITVRCPLNMSKSRVERFLYEKQSWIEKIIGRNSERLQCVSKVRNFNAVFVDGKQVPLILGSKNQVTADCVYLKSIKDIQKQFIKSFSQGFLNEVEYISKNSGLIPLSVKVKNYRAKWGCCDINGNIIFNYKLFMLPPNLREYVIIHELCHLKHLNHSAAFWGLVESFLPLYKSLKKQLKEYDFLTKLY